MTSQKGVAGHISHYSIKINFMTMQLHFQTKIEAAVAKKLLSARVGFIAGFNFSFAFGV